MLDGVVLLLEEVGLELAEVSGAGADGGGFDLNAEDVGAVGDADVVGGAVAPGPGDVVSLSGGNHSRRVVGFLGAR